MKKVLIIGGSGMVASRVIALLKNKLEITSVDQNTLDITDPNAIKNYFNKNIFDAVVNFAAATNVDEAEKERGVEGFTWKLNVEAVRNLISVCKEKSIFLVHISTDFIFQGNKKNKGPYDENNLSTAALDESIGWYGWTKRIAEKDISESRSKNAIIRYGYPFRAAEFEIKKDWARNLINLYNEQKLYPLFNDQIQSVLFIDDLAEPLAKIINEELTGIFHIVSCDTTNPYEIGKYLLEKYTGKSIDVQKGSIVELMKAKERTPRPIYGGLKTEITQKRLGMKFKTWRQMIDQFILQVQKT